MDTHSHLRQYMTKGGQKSLLVLVSPLTNPKKKIELKLGNQSNTVEFIATVMTSIINDEPKHRIPKEGAAKDSV